MLNPLIPYILGEALNVYGKRQSGIGGRQPMDFSPLMAMLQQNMSRYTQPYQNQMGGSGGSLNPMFQSMFTGGGAGMQGRRYRIDPFENSIENMS